MKAIVYHQYGSPGVLQLAEVEKPAPGNNEVLVKVHAASVNSWDWDLLRGKPFLTRMGGIQRPKYKILGADVAGRVEAVGPDVKQLKPGDAVFGDLSGYNWGGFAEYVCAPENVLALKPAGMTFDEAAAIPQAGVLALQGLRFRGPLQKGQKVLINGAGGGVGTFAVQMAKSSGAEVTGVDSTEKLDVLRAVGVDHVIDYRQEDFTRNGQRYDLVLDVAGYRSVFDYRRALNTGGTYVMVGGSTSRILQLFLLGPWIGMAGRKKMGLLLHKPRKEDLDVINALFEAGKIVPVIDKRYPLSGVPEALQYLGDGRTRGKVIIAISA